MAKKKENQIVKKSNAFIRGHWEIKSIWEPRLVALVASKIRMDDEDFKMYRLPIAEILEDARTDRSGKNYDDLENAIKNLMGRPLTIQETPSRLAIYNVFAKCIIDRKRGFVEMRFDPDLKLHFLDLKNRFTQYDLTEFMSLPSVYSQRMYEILKSWNDHDHPEIDIDLNELHDMLDTPVSYRSDFRNFRVYVLEQAHKDIVERDGCSLWYDWEPITSGRAGKVVAIHFAFNWAKAQEMKKNQPTDEHFIFQKLQKDSNQCFERLTRSRKTCTPKPKTPKCKFCLERGRMRAQEIIKANQGKLDLGEPETTTPMAATLASPPEPPAIEETMPPMDVATPPEPPAKRGRKKKQETWTIAGIDTGLPKEPIPYNAPKRKLKRLLKLEEPDPKEEVKA